jgi:hypothetical protein
MPHTRGSRSKARSGCYDRLLVVRGREGLTDDYRTKGDQTEGNHDCGERESHNFDGHFVLHSGCFDVAILERHGGLGCRLDHICASNK